MNKDYIINGMSPSDAIKRLHGISKHWTVLDKESTNLHIKSDNDIQEVYDILGGYEDAIRMGELSDEEIENINPYFEDWFGSPLYDFNKGYKNSIYNSVEEDK